MNSVTIQEAQVKLADLIHQLAPGQELMITENSRPIAKLVAEATLPARLRPPPGLGKGFIQITGEDDDHLEDFAEYMP